MSWVSGPFFVSVESMRRYPIGHNSVSLFPFVLRNVVNDIHYYGRLVFVTQGNSRAFELLNLPAYPISVLC